MTPLDRIETLVKRAETSEAPGPLLQEARDLLAQMALTGTLAKPGAILSGRLKTLAMRCSKNHGDQNTPMRLIAWGGLMSCIVDAMDGGFVCMTDGRVATAEGWDSSNCEPDDLHPQSK